MSDNRLWVALVAALVLFGLSRPQDRPRPPRPIPVVTSTKGSPGPPVIGGRIAPDGVTQLQCDLPRAALKKNIASQGLGCCVFRSGEYAGHWENEPEMYDLPEKMVQAHIAGGGWPEKVDKVFKQLAPHVQYVQDTSGDPEILKAILASGRIACVTYDGRDSFYQGQHVDHMVCLVHFDGTWAAILDNNHPQDTVWMSCPEFLKRWKGNQSAGWCYCLLAPPPPPVPHN